MKVKRDVAVLAVLVFALLGYYAVLPMLAPKAGTRANVSTPPPDQVEVNLGQPIGASSVVSQTTGNQVGELAPDFTVTTVDGETIRLSELRGKKSVLLYFFASWCPYCHQDFENVKDVYPGYDAVEFLNVDLDDGENADLIRNYRDQNGFVGKFAPLPRAEMLLDYSVIHTTTKYAIDKTGKIIWRGAGVASPETWEQLFISLSAS